MRPVCPCPHHSVVRVNVVSARVVRPGRGEAGQLLHPALQRSVVTRFSCVTSCQLSSVCSIVTIALECSLV